MEIKQFVWNTVDSNSWLIKEGRNGLLIDAVSNDNLNKELKDLETLSIILTHSHFDHICGLNHIRELFPNSKVISTKICSEYLGNIYRNMSSCATAFMTFYNGKKDISLEPIVCNPADEVFDEEYIFNWYGHNIKLQAVHGHSIDSLIAILDDQFLFSGDSLLSIPTVTRFPSGSTIKFWKEDIPRFNTMNSIEIVYPGHGSTGSLFNMISVNKCPEQII